MKKIFTLLVCILYTTLSAQTTTTVTTVTTTTTTSSETTDLAFVGYCSSGSTLGGEIQVLSANKLLIGLGYSIDNVNYKTIKDNGLETNDLNGSATYIILGYNSTKLAYGVKFGVTDNYIKSEYLAGGVLEFKVLKFMMLTAGYDTFNQGTIGVGLIF